MALLTKAKDFFSCVILLLNGNTPFTYGCAIGRYYYGVYHLARLMRIGRTGRDSRAHRETWLSMDKAIRKYGKLLKKLRVKYDYKRTVHELMDVKTDFQDIVSRRSEFNTIVQETEKTSSNILKDKKLKKEAQKLFAGIRAEESNISRLFQAKIAGK